MQRRKRLWAVRVAAVAAVATSIAHAGLISKTYEFKSGVTLEIGIQTDDGLRLDAIRFDLPSDPGTAGPARARVDISNIAPERRKVGVAIALFDEAGRLVGVASGGTKLFPVKPERQKTYDLLFDYVNREAARAKTFQVSLESKP